MDYGKLNPWNWFRSEDEERRNMLPGQGGDEHGEAMQPLVRLREEINHLFDSSFKTMKFRSPSMQYGMMPGIMQGIADDTIRPSVDVRGNEKEYHISAEMPGMSQDDIVVELKGDRLVIRGEKSEEDLAEDEGYYRQERSYGAYRRVLTLPEDADADGIRASYHNGVVSVTLPRKEETDTPTKRVELD